MSLAIAGIFGLFACTYALRLFVRQPVYGIYCAIFVSAILQTPRLPLVREKLTACEIVMLLTWLGMLGYRQSGIPLLRCQKSAIAAAVLLLLITGLSCWSSLFTANANLARSFVETANYAYGFLLFLTAVHLVDSWRKWLHCLYAWLCGTALVSLVGVWSMVGGAPVWTRDHFTGRLSSTLRLSNQLPGYCLPVLVVVLVLAACKKLGGLKRGALVLLAGGIATCVVGSGSRTGFLLLCLCFPAMMLVVYKERRNPHLSVPFSMALGTLTAVVGVLIVLSVVATADRPRSGKVAPYERPIRLFSDWVQGKRALDDNRSHQAQLVLERVPDHPMLGVGPANFTVTYHTHEVHNTYLGVLGEEGLLGLAALLGWLGTVAHNGRLGVKQCAEEGRRVVALAALVGFAILVIYGMGMFGLRQRPFWFMSALLVALPRVVHHEARITRVCRPRGSRSVTLAPVHSGRSESGV